MSGAQENKGAEQQPPRRGEDQQPRAGAKPGAGVKQYFFLHF